MAYVEVDEAEYKNLATIAQWLDTAAANPSTRQKLLKIRKELDPNAIIPEIDTVERVAAPIYDAISKLNKRLDEQDTYREAEKVAGQLSEQWNQGRGKVKARGFTEEGLQEIEQLMQERGILNHEDALVLYERMHPSDPASPRAGKFDVLNPLHRQKDTLTEDLMRGKLTSRQFLQAAAAEAVQETQ